VPRLYAAAVVSDDLRARSSSRQRRLIRARFYGRRPARQVAASFGVTVETMHKWCMAIYAKLRTCLEWLAFANPVLIAGHTYVGPGGEATVIGSWLEVKITREGLLARARFANTPLAEEYFSLYKDGHMKAFSVGWITRAFEMRDTKLPDGTNKRIRWFTKVELIEISAVAIPANRESLVRAASAAPGRREQKGERLGRRIRAAREEKEMTLEQVAAELPITASTLQNIENGTIIRPSRA